MTDRRRMGELMRRDTYSLGRQAGTADLPPTVLDLMRSVPQQQQRTPDDLDRERNEGFRAWQDASRFMIDSERFSEAVSRMPMSGNVVYATPSSFDERFRGF